jgi:hypothetical protein
MYSVLFNHQAERPSFVISSAGVAIWCVTPPLGASMVWPRTVLALSAVIGLRTPPLLLVWMVAQLELYGWRAVVPHWLPSATLGPSPTTRPNGSATSLAAEEP